MRQGSNGSPAALLLVVPPGVAAWAGSGAEALGEVDTGRPPAACSVLFGGQKFRAGASPRSVAMGDPDGSGTVDFGDVIEVLIGWGACP